MSDRTKTIWLFLMLSTMLVAKSSTVNYKATFGIFGKVGTITNKITQNEKHYKIETTVQLAGMAKTILGGQREHYISEGHMENGMMVSDHYIMTTNKKNQKKIKEYHINHIHKTVTKHYKKWKNGKVVRDLTQQLNFYAKNDLLTLYFNMDKAIKEKGKVYIMKAIGLEKQKGIVQVTVPSDAQSARYKKDLGPTANWYAKARIVQENFRKKSGDILLSVAADGFIQKAVIKDILMFGDAKLIRTK